MCDLKFIINKENNYKFGVSFCQVCLPRLGENATIVTSLGSLLESLCTFYDDNCILGLVPFLLRPLSEDCISDSLIRHSDSTDLPNVSPCARWLPPKPTTRAAFASLLNQILQLERVHEFTNYFDCQWELPLLILGGVHPKEMFDVFYCS